MFTSFSSCDVIEYLVFIGHTSIHAIRHHWVSQHPFGLRLFWAPIYRITQYHSLFTHSSARHAIVAPYGVSTILFLEHIGFTKFCIMHILNTLEAIFKPRIICPFPITCSQPLWSDSLPFGLSVSDYFRLSRFTTLAVVQLSFSSWYSYPNSSFKPVFWISPYCPESFAPQRYRWRTSPVGLPQTEGVAHGNTWCNFLSQTN